MSTPTPQMQGLEPWLKAAGRPAAWGCIAAVAVLSLTPSAMMTRTSMGGHLEHTAAYAGTAFLTAAAYGGLARIAAGLILYSGALELLQHFSPGRTPSLEDCSFSAIGTVLGVAAAALLQRWLAATRRA